MIVHPDQAGDHRVAGQVHNFGALGWRRARRGSDCLDLALGDDHGLVFACWPTSAVNHSHMAEHDHR